MRAFLKYAVLGFLVSFFGCKKTEEPVAVVLEGQPQTFLEVSNWPLKKPQVKEPVSGKDYYIVKIIPPDTRIDHKINIIKPKPDIDFKIGIINPYARNLPPEFNEKMAELLRKHRQEQSLKP